MSILVKHNQVKPGNLSSGKIRNEASGFLPLQGGQQLITAVPETHRFQLKLTAASVNVPFQHCSGF